MCTPLGYVVMPTPLYPVTEKFVRDEFARIRDEQVIPWVFMTAGPPFRILRFNGKPIAYQGIKFEGSPRLVFWSNYIEPFLENAVNRGIDEVRKSCLDRGIHAAEPLRELRGLLVSSVTKTYAHMADVDRRLRGGGFPQSVEERDTQPECSAMLRFIEARIEGEIAMLKSPSRFPAFSKFYRDHPEWVWAIGTGVGVLATLAATLLT